MSMNIISVDNVSVCYHSVEVVSDVSFNISAGDYLGIVGPNGSGKTTLIRAVLGLVQPLKGTISIFGQDVSEFRGWNKIGYLPQRLFSFSPQFPATIKEIVALGLLAQKRFPKYIRGSDEPAINKVLGLFDLIKIKNKLIGELSGGQQQRVLLARAMVGQPQVLVLDEPTTALDPEAREKFSAVLQELNKSFGLTIVLVTHDIMNIGRYASKLLYLDRKLIFHGSFDDFCSSSDVTDYFGEFAQHVICHRHS
jgi:zinc transport system ATP-binding protein